MITNKKEITLAEKKMAINSKGLDKLNEYFNLSQSDLAKVKPDVLRHLYNMARIGMSFERQVNISRLADETNRIKIAKLITENKKELQAYIKRTLPQYS